MKFELEIIHWLQSIRSSLLDTLFEFFTLFGEEVVVIIVLGAVYWCINKKAGERLGITVFISLGLNSVLKFLIMRPRPFVVDDTIINLRPETSGGYSMPSGHSQTASTLTFGLYQFFKKKYLLIIAIVISTLVALSRMYIGVHYLSDVVVGVLLGIVITYVLYNWLRKKDDLTVINNFILILSVIALIFIFTINIIELNKTTFDSQLFYFNTEAIAKMLGTLVGFVIGIKLENKVVKFSNHNNLFKNILRLVLGLGIIMILRLGLKEIFKLLVNPENLVDDQLFLSILASFFDFLRYVIMVVVGIGLYPIIFKKINI